jgi:hypothetical protein
MVGSPSGRAIDEEALEKWENKTKPQKEEGRLFFRFTLRPF